MIENDVNSILRNKLPRSWTTEDADLIKEYFREQRPVVSALLAKALWRYWYQQSSDEPLFKVDEDNMALLLHARAYGEPTPEPNDSGIVGRYLHDPYELKPLMQAHLNWGPRAVLASEVLAGLDSPVMHAWVFVDGVIPQQILIVGEGLPEIRDRVVPEAFMTSLQVHGGADDMMNLGVLRIQLPGNQVTQVTTLDFPFPIIGDLREPLPPAAAETAEAALQELYGYLGKLERDSGLVQVHHVDINAQTNLSDALRNYARQASDDHHQAILWEGAGQETENDLVTLIPYWLTSGTTRTLNMTLSADLLRTQTYERLLKVYNYATIQRGLIDVGARRDYYEREADRLEAEKRHFEQATPEQRVIIWGKTVLLTEKFEHALGVTIKLAEPEEMPTELFFIHNAPGLIEHHRAWQRRMERIIYSVQEAYNRADAPVRRFAASRFLDAAIRERRPDESRAALVSFEAWSKLVQPLLWFEWRCFLTREGIDPERLITPHTFFQTWLSPTRDGQEIARLVMSPFTLVDQNRSVALFDANHRVMEMRDATDYAELVSVASQSADELWQDLKRKAEKEDTTEEEFINTLRQGLQEVPLDMTKQILETLLASNLAEQTNPVLAGRFASLSAYSERRELDNYLAEAQRKTEVSHRLGQALMALKVSAFQTARKSLKASASNPQLTVRLSLLRAVVECFAEEVPFADELPAIYYRKRFFPTPAIQSALDQARIVDEDYVRAWIMQLENEETRDRAVVELLHGLPQARKECAPAEYAALLARGAIESVNLARELEQAAATLAEEHEFMTTAFAKVGWKLEKILLPEFTGAPQDELFSLIEVLTGEALPQYPGMGG